LPDVRGICLKSLGLPFQGVRMEMWSSAGEGTAQGFCALHLAPLWVLGVPKAGPVLATPAVAEDAEKRWLSARLGSFWAAGRGSPSAVSESWQKPLLLESKNKDAANAAKI
jgi:hypothetical protein